MEALKLTAPLTVLRFNGPFEQEVDQIAAAIHTGDIGLSFDYHERGTAMDRNYNEADLITRLKNIRRGVVYIGRVDQLSPAVEVAMRERMFAGVTFLGTSRKAVVGAEEIQVVKGGPFQPFVLVRDNTRAGTCVVDLKAHTVDWL